MFDDLTRRIRDRRRAPRFGGRGIRVQLSGRRVALVNVSASGIRIHGLDGTSVGQQFDGRMTISGGASGKFVAEVVWVQEALCGLRFLEIAPDLFMNLHDHMTADAQA